MDDISAFLAHVRRAAAEEREKLQRLRELEEQLNRDPLYSEHIEAQIARVSAELEASRGDMEALVRILLRVPPWHARHREALRQFARNGDYERSIFIMTKFPEGNTDADTQLQRVIAAVSEGVSSRGLVPRIATGAQYHDWLWDEVEIHLLGSSLGIAIIEDQYRPELNPNVAMEWGWMRAMGKRVLYLQEEAFGHGRADIVGLRAWKFKWAAPEEGIAAALDGWFGTRTPAPTMGRST